MSAVMTVALLVAIVIIAVALSTVLIVVVAIVAVAVVVVAVIMIAVVVAVIVMGRCYKWASTLTLSTLSIPLDNRCWTCCLRQDTVGKTHSQYRYIY